MYAFPEMTFAPAAPMACHSPVAMNTVAVTNGFVPGDVSGPFVWADLSCGDGLRALIMAACYPDAEIHAFENGAKAERGKFFAKVAGLTNIVWHEAPLNEMAAQDLPPLNYVVWDSGVCHLHEAGRSEVFKTVGEAMAPGGLLMIGYYALPGFAAMLPLRDILHSVTHAYAGVPQTRVREALSWLEQTNVDGLGYLADHAGVRHRLAMYADIAADVVADELFAPHLMPLHFAQVREGVAPYGLRFAGNSAYHLNMVDTAVPAALRRILYGAKSRNELETVRDVLRNTFYRRDVYVKGEQLTDMNSFWAAHDALTVRLSSDATSTDFAGFSVDYSGFPFSTLREGLADKPHQVAHIPELLPAIARDAVRAALAGGWVEPCIPVKAQEQTVGDAAIHIPSAVNRALMTKAANFDYGVPLASPVLGGPVLMEQDMALVLGAIAATGCEPEAAQETVTRHLAATLEMPEGDATAHAGMEAMVKQVLAQLTPDVLNHWVGLGIISS